METHTLEEYIEAIRAAQKSADYDAMLKLCQHAAQEFPSVDEVKGYLHDAQAHYVSEKLHSEVVKQLIEKDDFVTLYAVYQKLLAVFPESRKLKKLLHKVEKKVEYAHSHQQQIYLKDGKVKIHALMKEKKYDQALQACYELKTYAAKDKSLEALTLKVRAKRDTGIEKILVTFYKDAMPKLSKEYQANKKAFIRV